jgi:hypothetical protein
MKAYTIGHLMPAEQGTRLKEPVATILLQLSVSVSESPPTSENSLDYGSNP